MTAEGVRSVTDFDAAFEEELANVPAEYADESRFVPGVGPFDADVMLIGEAPGENEVSQREPFVGRAGAELDEVLATLGVDRESVYVTNIVKIRPPENRTPHVAEIEAWLPVLEAEFDRVDPAVVVTLGNTATQVLLDDDQPIGAVHGRTFERDGRYVVPAYHPAAGLYDRSKRETVEADLRAAFEVAESE